VVLEKYSIFFCDDVACQDWLSKMDEEDVDFELLIVNILKWCRSHVCVIVEQGLSHAFGIPTCSKCVCTSFTQVQVQLSLKL
jgi:hypothetical protein